MSNEKITIANQRNLNDVATELTLKYMESHSLNVEKIVEVYKAFYKAAVEAWNGEYPFL